MYLFTMEFYSATKKNEILSFAGKWMKLENISWVKLARLKKPKAVCFLSYVEFRPNINTAILWKIGHTKREVTYDRWRVKEEN
jgi:hypothetical protein